MNLDEVEIKFNYHTHTFRNGHSNKEATDEDYIKAALAEGITTLGFSEHCPYKDNYAQRLVRMDYEQIDEYITTLKSLREKYKDECKILIGFECEYYPEKLDEYKHLHEISDYLILGQHFSTYGENFLPPYSFECDDEKAIEYTNFVLQGLDSGLFTYIAHPDYFFGGTDTITPVFEECARKICKKCEDLNIPMEINFNGSNLHPKKQPYTNGEEHYRYPNRLFWQIAKEYNINCVVGIDAHDPVIIIEKDKLINLFKVEVNDLGLNILTEPFIK